MQVVRRACMRKRKEDKSKEMDASCMGSRLDLRARIVVATCHRSAARSCHHNAVDRPIVPEFSKSVVHCDL